MTAAALTSALNQWSSMTADQRRKLILRDRSMRHPAYARLVETLATAPIEKLSPLQLESIPAFLRGARS